MTQGALLEASNLSVTRGAQIVLENLDIQINEGDVVCLTGENGSGKTTLIESLIGILPINSGQIKWLSGDGNSVIVRDHLGARRRPFPFGLTLQSDGICGEEKVKERLEAALKVTGLNLSQSEIMSSLDEWGLSHRSEDRVSQLSAGLRRRLSVLSGMAPALFCETPRIIFLDEPSEGLDLFSKSLLKSWIGELSANGNAVVMASHDEDVISCSTRILKVEGGRISETKNQIEISGFNERKLSVVTSSDSIRSFFSWGVSIERRNPVDTIGKATPAILSLLLTYSIVGRTNISDSEFDLFSALILAPAFISAIVSPAMIRRLNEEDCGKWWSAICGPQFRPATSILASSIILPIPLTYLSWFVLEGLITGVVDQNAIYWLWLPSLVIIDISCASTALHMLVSDLRRSSAAAASLLLVVLVWPFIQVVDALSMILDNGMTWEFSTSSPLMSLIFASVISAMVWAVAIFIPDA